MKDVRSSCGALVILCLGLSAAGEELVQPKSVNRLVADGKHNAFTALVRWRDHYWLAYRSGKSHNSGDGDIVLRRSKDGRSWDEAFRLNIFPDDRDPQFLATAERLFLYTPAMDGSKLISFVTFTRDGTEWEEPRTVYQRQFIFWKPMAVGNRFYATAHKKDESATAGKEREVHMITSTDALMWEKVSTMRAGNWESETTLWLAPDKRLFGFIRTKYSVQGHILEAVPPYKEWKERPAGVHLSGHAVHTFRGVTYLLSRTMDEAGKDTGTMIYTFDGHNLAPYCKLPSGGDCSYAEAVESGDEMLVSYYSSHEEGTNIYLARVPLK